MDPSIFLWATPSLKSFELWALVSKVVYNGTKDSELLGDINIYFGVKLPRMMPGGAPPSRSVATAPARTEQQTSCLRLGAFSGLLSCEGISFKLPEEQCIYVYVYVYVYCIHTPTHQHIEFLVYGNLCTRSLDSSREFFVGPGSSMCCQTFTRTSGPGASSQR